MSSEQLPTVSLEPSYDITAIVVIGMAGSGKSSLVNSLSKNLPNNPLIVNLDPAVINLPYEPSIDIRKSVDYYQLMKDCSLGPNGGIMTALNIYAAQFDRVIDDIENRVKNGYVIIDTPGQIEVFNWSASGQLILESLGVSFQTICCYCVDGPNCVSNPLVFMSNMTYSLSILSKTELPTLICFNKMDENNDYDLTGEQMETTLSSWMTDFDAFSASCDDDYISSDFIGPLIRSVALNLEDLYRELIWFPWSSLNYALKAEEIVESKDEKFIGKKDNLLKKIQIGIEEYNDKYRSILSQKRMARDERRRKEAEEMTRKVVEVDDYDEEEEYRKLMSKFK